MKKPNFWLFTCAIACLMLPSLLDAQSGKLSVQYFTVAFYNTENLADTLDDPATEDEEFTPGGKMRWNHERYERKLGNMAKVLNDLMLPSTDSIGKPGKMRPEPKTGPRLDLLGMCEVENRQVIMDLLKKASLDQFYDIVHFDSRYHRGMDVALLVDRRTFKVTDSVAHPVVPDPAKPTQFSRDILQVDLQPVRGKGTLTVFVNHWPSRRNPEAERLRTASKLRYLVDSIQKADPERYILIMGDLNDEPSNTSIRDSLRGRPDPKNLGSRDLYAAMAHFDSLNLGSHSYNQEWSMLDNILLNSNLLNMADANGLRYVQGSAEILKPDYLQESNPRFRGQPFRTYVGERYLGGYSDHFPIRVRLRLRSQE